MVENEDRLDRIDLPVRVLWGVEDTWIPQATGDRLAAAIRGAAFAPVALATELRSWLSVSAALPGRVER
ncbi:MULTISPECIES: hypothetical protein [unclassified Amycolatopsis]|uniref:hypothetical protein n=1 Tax=unclassified Amycolatopsis TaxID=2618356 RepID=UPI00287B9B13|nr:MULTISPECIES: hypothetical protein [unclassified Amycolatopsis]